MLSSVLCPEEELEDERELLEGAFEMNLFENDKGGEDGGIGLMRIPGLVLARGRSCELY